MKSRFGKIPGRVRALVTALLVPALPLLAADATTGLIPLDSGDRAVAQYQPSAAPMKPYLKELFSPSGVEVTVDSPPDHFHHHGLMFAVGADAEDFWTEQPLGTLGREWPRAGETRVGTDRVAQILDWVDHQGHALVVEQREVRVQSAIRRGPNVLTWRTTLAPAGTNGVKLWGRHFFGLGLRFPADMDGKAKFILPAGTPGGRIVRSDETLRAAEWCAATGAIGGHPVTLAMWDHPQNSRRVVWFTMTQPFSYLSATLNLETHPLDLKAGQKLPLCFGLAVFDGITDAEQIAQTREQWLRALQATTPNKQTSKL